MSWLSGKKTHLAMLALAIAAFLKGALGIEIDDSWLVAIAAFGGIAMRSGIAKAEKAGQEEAP